MFPAHANAAADFHQHENRPEQTGNDDEKSDH
jgi:hypothetical protein